MDPYTLAPAVVGVFATGDPAAFPSLIASNYVDRQGLGAELVVIEGLGHDLPRALWPELADRIAGLESPASRRRASDQRRDRSSRCGGRRPSAKPLDRLRHDQVAAF